MSQIPIYIIHYKGNVDRRRYLDGAFARLPVQPQFITQFDREEFSLDSVYRYDEAQFREMLLPIKDVLIGNVIALTQQKSAPWTNCVSLHARQNRSLDQDFQVHGWLRPRPLRAAEVSVFLKHRVAWEKIAEGDCEWGIVAEDDILFHEQSQKYLDSLPSMLPEHFDYVDLAGGCGMLPRMGNPVENEVFFAIDPPNTRTVCCALMKRSLARRLVEAAPPICLPVDWTLTHLLKLENSSVYWIHPPIFVHGSETNFYKSGTQPGAAAAQAAQHPRR
jgi:GR25 family glycosyltransferase involved in LPS biosynthesis